MPNLARRLKGRLALAAGTPAPGKNLTISDAIAMIGSDARLVGDKPGVRAAGE